MIENQLKRFLGFAEVFHNIRKRLLLSLAESIVAICVNVCLKKEKEMLTGNKDKKTSMLSIGSILIIASYILWAPMFLFVALALGDKALFWCSLATAAYIVSWILLITGFVLAGPDAARSGHRWVNKLFRKKLH
ncbi:MAG: hypothetical protein MRK02_04875 [Candidatus Scalindua sp.]|nr:hypothetical protein [Candidatus Scalindua sp.]